MQPKESHGGGGLASAEGQQPRGCLEERPCYALSCELGARAIADHPRVAFIVVDGTTY